MRTSLFIPYLSDSFAYYSALLCVLLISLTESLEDIPSGKKKIQQAICQASKLLHPTNQDYKRLEVSDRQYWKLIDLRSFVLMQHVTSLKFIVL